MLKRRFPSEMTLVRNKLSIGKAHPEAIVRADVEFDQNIATKLYSVECMRALASETFANVCFTSASWRRMLHRKMRSATSPSAASPGKYRSMAPAKAEIPSHGARHYRACPIVDLPATLRRSRWSDRRGCRRLPSTGRGSQARRCSTQEIQNNRAETQQQSTRSAATVCWRHGEGVGCTK